MIVVPQEMNENDCSFIQAATSESSHFREIIRVPGGRVEKRSG